MSLNDHLNVVYVPHFSDTSFAPLQQTPLWVASSKGFLEVVKLLVERGADINAVAENNVKYFTEITSQLFTFNSS